LVRTLRQMRKEGEKKNLLTHKLLARSREGPKEDSTKKMRAGLSLPNHSTEKKGF